MKGRAGRRIILLGSGLVAAMVVAVTGFLHYTTLRTYWLLHVLKTGTLDQQHTAWEELRRFDSCQILIDLMDVFYGLCVKQGVTIPAAPKGGEASFRSIELYLEGLRKTDGIARAVLERMLHLVQKYGQGALPSLIRGTRSQSGIKRAFSIYLMDGIASLPAEAIAALELAATDADESVSGCAKACLLRAQ